MNIQQTIATRLKKSRQERGLSQYALAKILQTDHTSISHYERIDGGRSPSLTKLIKLAIALGVSIDYLVGRTELKCVDLG